VIPGLPLRSLRVSDGSLLQGDRPAAVARAIRHVVQPAGRAPLAPVINISLGRRSGHKEMGEAVDAAYEKGIIIVAAAGQVTHSVVFPARYERCIAVAGIEKRPGRTFGVYAPYDDEDDGYAYVDVWAPARGFPRATLSSPVADNPPPASYVYGFHDPADGTTYAATHVSAAAALWLAFHGAALEARYAQPWMRIEAFRRLLLTHNPVSVFPVQVTRELRRRGNRAFPLKMLALLKAPLPDITAADKRGT